ncbi:MAG: hypothetical protein KR126chlam3_01053 [Chlamydiae bacterium]|nr:hypothetical protein [Chlamydiota bacterium]
MSGELKELGEKFRKKREEMQFTLREVENSTSIRTSFIQAIEEGTINEFLAGVYALGFIKQYASFLQLDVERIMKEYPRVFRMRGLHHDFNYGIGTLEMRSSLSGGMKWLPNLLWAGGIAAAIVITYYFAKAVGLL